MRPTLARTIVAGSILACMLAGCGSASTGSSAGRTAAPWIMSPWSKGTSSEATSSAWTPQPLTPPPTPGPGAEWSQLIFSDPMPIPGFRTASLGAVAAIDLGDGHLVFAAGPDGNTMVSQSKDWDTWTSPVLVSGPASMSPERMASNGKTLVFVEGSGRTVNCDSSGQNCATTPVGVWTSVDGVEWSRRELPGSANSGTHTIAAGPGGFVIDGSTDLVSALWYSSDGTTWEKVALPEDPFPRGSALSGLVFDPSLRAFLMAGCLGETVIPTFGSTCERPAAWLSSNGTSWSPAVVEMPAEGADSMNVLHPARDGVLATGLLVPGGDCAQCSVRAAWTSSDGRAWSYRPIDTKDNGARPSFEPSLPISFGSHVVGDGARLISAFTPDPNDFGRVEFWLSSNGSDWRQLSVGGSTRGRSFALAAPPALHLISGNALLTIAGIDGQLAVSRGWATS